MRMHYNMRMWGEEDRLASYLLQMSEMGTRFEPWHYGDASGLPNRWQSPEKSSLQTWEGQSAWMDGFLRCHPRLTIHSPQPLSYCRGLRANMDIINDFFGKLGSIYGKLNLISKPMQVYNCDETGVSIVHKPSKVIAEFGRHNIYAITRVGRPILSTNVSASGYALSPMMVYPRKKSVPEKLISKRELYQTHYSQTVKMGGWTLNVLCSGQFLPA